MSGPCAKARVVCVLVTPEGRTFRGENSCLNPQATCPRAPGEGYGPCRDICRQPSHAEIAALAKAREWAIGATAYVQWKRVCADCEAALLRAGVAAIILGAPPP